VAAPFFTPYMLGPLELSYAGFTVLTATALGARIAVMPLLGRQAQRRGTRPLLWAGALAVVPLPSLWLVSDAFAWLLFVQVLSGAAWATLELATLLSFFDELEPRVRTSVLAVFNFANAAAAAAGAVAGGWLLHQLGAAPGAYAALFAVSSTARLAGLVFLPRRRPLPQAPGRPGA
jgi:MFS family permease